MTSYHEEIAVHADDGAKLYRKNVVLHFALAGIFIAGNAARR